MNSKKVVRAKAVEAAAGIVEMATAHYLAVHHHDWVRTEELAQELAEMAALSADGAQIMGQMEDD